LTGEVDLKISRKLEGFKHNIGSNNGYSRMDDPYLQSNNQAKQKKGIHTRENLVRSLIGDMLHEVVQHIFTLIATRLSISQTINM